MVSLIMALNEMLFERHSESSISSELFASIYALKVKVTLPGNVLSTKFQNSTAGRIISEKR